MHPITSRNNPKLKNAIRLHESRGRRQQGRIIIFGNAEIARAASAGLEFVELFCDENSELQLAQLVAQHSSLSSCESYSLPAALFQKLAFGDRKSGLVAIAKRPETSLENFNPSDNALVLILEAIEKPGNIGAVFRSASGAGVDAIILADPITDGFHPNAIRASLGSVFSIPVFTATSKELLKVLRKNGFKIVATRVEGSQSCFECDLTTRTAIAMGNEAQGLSDQWTGDGVVPVMVPMAGKIDSLNIAMTATLLAYEAFRQRSL